MNSSVIPRMYVASAFAEQGLNCPERYISLLEQTPENRVIENLAPWCFLPDPSRSSEYCSLAFGRPILPFSQAIGEDMMACFDLQASPEPAVVVINPWNTDKMKMVYAELKSFDEWLVYAKQISNEVMEREKEELDGDD